MEYTIRDMIGMLNLGIVAAHGKKSDKVEIPIDAALEIAVYLQDLCNLVGES